jgi:hypothetical protein
LKHRAAEPVKAGSAPGGLRRLALGLGAADADVAQPVVVKPRQVAPLPRPRPPTGVRAASRRRRERFARGRRAVVCSSVIVSVPGETALGPGRGLTARTDEAAVEAPRPAIWARPGRGASALTRAQGDRLKGFGIHRCDRF